MAVNHFFYDLQSDTKITPFASAVFDGKYTSKQLEALVDTLKISPLPSLSWNVMQPSPVVSDTSGWLKQYSIVPEEDSTLVKSLLGFLTQFKKATIVHPVLVPGLHIVVDPSVFSFESKGGALNTLTINDPSPIITNGENYGLYNAHFTSTDMPTFTVVADISLDPMNTSMEIAKNRIYTKLSILKYAETIGAIPYSPLVRRVTESEVNYTIKISPVAGKRQVDLINTPVAMFISRTPGVVYSLSNYIHKRIMSSSNYYAICTEILNNMEHLVRQYITGLKIPEDGKNFFWPIYATANDIALVGLEEKHTSINPFRQLYVYKWGTDSNIMNVINLIEKVIKSQDKSLQTWQEQLIKTRVRSIEAPEEYIRECLKSILLYIVYITVDEEMRVIQSLAEKNLGVQNAVMKMRDILKEDTSRLIQRPLTTSTSVSQPKEDLIPMNLASWYVDTRDVTEGNFVDKFVGSGGFKYTTKDNVQYLTTGGRTWICGPSRYISSTPVQLPRNPKKLTVMIGDVMDICFNLKPGSVVMAASNFHGFEMTSNGQKWTEHDIRDYPSDPTQGPYAQLAFLPQLIRRVDEVRKSGKLPVSMLADLERIGVKTTESGWAVVKDAQKRSPDDFTVYPHVKSIISLSDVVLGGKTGNVFKMPLIPSMEEFKKRKRPTMYIMMAAALDLTFDLSAEWARIFLRAGYLNLFNAAIDVNAPQVMLTLLGGGVFKNNYEEIFNAIKWAWAHCKSQYTGEIILNLYDTITERGLFRHLENLKALLGEQTV